MWTMAEREPRNTIADELLSRVALDTPASRQAVAGGASMFLIDPDRAQEFINDISAAAARLSEARNLVARARWDYLHEADRVSGNFAVQAARMSDNARAAAVRHQEALIDVARELERQLTAYRQAEQINTPGPRQ